MMRFCVIFWLLIIIAANIYADTPVGPMNYQGRLLDNNGIPVTGSYDFVVGIYNDPSAGTLKYQETHNDVMVDDGVYSFLIGTQAKDAGDSTWSVELWNCCANLYLEIVVGTDTLSPRHRLAAAPYAFQANLALTTNNALALSGRPGEWYGDTLEAICVSSKGKWLELALKCLGIGASFPGPTMVPLSTLTASTDLKGLDLTRADISGIDFGSADFSGSLLKDTVVQPAGIDSVNFSDAQLDNIVSINSGIVNANFTNALIGNMQLGYWDLSGATLTGISAAMLIGCPWALPAAYKCAGKDTGGGDWRYMIVGPDINLSSDSLMKNKLNPQFVLGSFFSDVSLANINFSGNALSSFSFPAYASTVMTGAKFDGADIRSVSFSGNMAGTSFDRAVIKSGTFYNADFTPLPPNFDGAELTFVLFNVIKDNSVFDFNNTLLTNVEIRGSAVAGYGQNMVLNIDNSRVSNLLVSAELDSLTIVNSIVAGGLTLPSYPAISNIVIGGPSNVVFQGGIVAGNYTGANFTGSVFYSVSFRGANLTNITGVYPSSFQNVDWFGATCPNGTLITTIGDTCIGKGI